MEGATSISTILLVDVDVGSFSPYKYVPTPWAKHTKTTVRGAPSLRNSLCSKLEFSLHLSCHCRPTPTTPAAAVPAISSVSGKNHRLAVDRLQADVSRAGLPAPLEDSTWTMTFAMTFCPRSWGSLAELLVRTFAGFVFNSFSTLAWDFPFFSFCLFHINLWRPTSILIRTSAARLSATLLKPAPMRTNRSPP